MLASSSINRILGFDFWNLMLFHARQDNAEGRTAIEFGLILDCTAMFFNNARRDRKAQPRAGLFGGKERVEKPLLNFQGDTLAGVNYLQNDYGSGLTRQGHHGASRTQGNRAVPSDTFRGVLDEVNQHLFDLLRVNSNPQGR